MNHWHFIREGSRNGPILWTEKDRAEIHDYFARNFPTKLHWNIEPCEDIECLLDTLAK